MNRLYGRNGSWNASPTKGATALHLDCSGGCGATVKRFERTRLPLCTACKARVHAAVVAELRAQGLRAFTPAGLELRNRIWGDAGRIKEILAGEREKEGSRDS